MTTTKNNTTVATVNNTTVVEEKVTSKKMTKKDWFKELEKLVKKSEYGRKEEMLKFITHEVELLDKKHSKSGQTKIQKENLEIMEKIVASLKKVEKPVTITELQASDKEMAVFSNQKLSALLKKLVESDRVVKTTEKKKSMFSVK